jgi:hypothetical protein
VRPYKGDLSVVANYGFSGGNAHLGDGPELEEKVIKAFFYEGSDGLAFYMIQNVASGQFSTATRIFISTKNNTTNTSVALSDEAGDIILVDSDSAKQLLDLPLEARLFDGAFTYTGETAGGVISSFDDLSEVRPWEVILDPIDTGGNVMIKAADGKDDSELVLAQGPVKVNFDFSTLRQPLGAQDDEDAESPNAWGGLYGVNTGTGGQDSWWFRFVGDPTGPEGPNPYSLLDGTYGFRAPDIGTGLIYGVVSAVEHQNIRMWRDYTPGEIQLVGAIDRDVVNWDEPPQTPDMRIYSINPTTEFRFNDTNRPITMRDLRVLCTSYNSPATTFSITVIDDDGNAFEFPERTILRRNDDPNALSWVSFGSPTSPEVVMVETNPLSLDVPPTGAISGNRLSGGFRKTLDLRKIKRVIVDIKHAQKDQIVLGIHTISGMLDGMPRWPDGHEKATDEPNAYAIIEAFSVYWRYEVPDDGWPETPDNIIGHRLRDYWPPQAVIDTWSIIPGFVGESIEKEGFLKDPLEEILNNRIIFTPVPPTDGCQMFWKQVEWLERGHRIGAACSFHVVIDGMGFIISKRSIGIDTTCGGGESEDNPCVMTFLSGIGGHPAIAWPSMDGDEFIGRPTSGYVTFIKDEDLSNRILAKLNAGEVTNINGDPVNNIPFIVFPSL